MATEEQIQYLPLDKVDRDPDQPRQEFAAEPLQGLAASLKEVGQLTPIRVRFDGERFIVIDGERRSRAAKLAGFATIAAIVEDKAMCPGEIVHRQLIANCQREDLRSMEKAHAIQRLMDETGWNATEVAQRLGFSKATVSRLMSLLELPEPIRDRVDSGEIPLSAANSLARVTDGEQQAALASQVVAGSLTRDGLAGTLKAHRNGDKQTRRGVSRVVCKLPSATVTVSAEDSLDLEAFVSILEELLGKARRARTQGIELSTLSKMIRDQANA